MVCVSGVFEAYRSIFRLILTSREEQAVTETFRGKWSKLINIRYVFVWKTADVGHWKEFFFFLNVAYSLTSNTDWLHKKGERKKEKERSEMKCLVIASF